MMHYEFCRGLTVFSVLEGTEETKNIKQSRIQNFYFLFVVDSAETGAWGESKFQSVDHLKVLR